mmetsp:Transcript_32229/g.78327  ORF Transcript_32229/g.78327 Transcript_32229/m.78327 type:complete len:583 (+) Transcript_32229:254-2002(+)
MLLKDLLNKLLSSPHITTFPSIEEIGYFESFILSIMFISILWLMCISISLTLVGSADGFRITMGRKLDTEKLKEMAKAESIRKSFRSTTDYINELKNDLSPPFRLELQDLDGLPGAIHSPDVTHFLFLMHGHRGQSKDLAYMHTVMQRIAATKKKRMSRAGSPSRRGRLSKTDPNPVKHDMVVHNAVSNEHKTDDGIQNGGDRLVEEMRQVIEDEMEKRHPNSKDVFDITISILGNSLGGLYGRYAIAKLVERHCVRDGKGANSCWILDGRYRLHLNVFCTTATPHLGVSKHTFLPIPRTAEIAAATIMKDTGKDLFRMNDLIHTMATCPTFLRPLANFRKRIAYANAFNTDFPVPTATAAFLSENSTYPHYFEDESLNIQPEATPSLNMEQGATAKSPKRRRSFKKGNSPDRARKKLFVASLYTRTLENKQEDTSDSMQPDGADKHKDEFHHMSECLDQLGWKKVFIDIRSELPSVELPKGFIKKKRKEPSKEPSKDESPRCIHSLKRQRKSLSSKDLASAVAQANDNRVSWPLGHNMIVAFSRSRMSTLMNRGGRPVVDAVAKELVEDIFTWDSQKSTKQ